MKFISADENSATVQLTDKELRVLSDALDLASGQEMRLGDELMSALGKIVLFRNLTATDRALRMVKLIKDSSIDSI